MMCSILSQEFPQCCLWVTLHPVSGVSPVLSLSCTPSCLRSFPSVVFELSCTPSCLRSFPSVVFELHSILSQEFPQCCLWVALHPVSGVSPVLSLSCTPSCLRSFPSVVFELHSILSQEFPQCCLWVALHPVSGVSPVLSLSCTPSCLRSFPSVVFELHSILSQEFPQCCLWVALHPVSGVSPVLSLSCTPPCLPPILPLSCTPSCLRKQFQCFSLRLTWLHPVSGVSPVLSLLHSILSQEFPQCCLWVALHPVSQESPPPPPPILPLNLKQFQCFSGWHGPFSLFATERSSSTSSVSVYLSLPGVFGVMPMVLCPQDLIQTPQHFTSDLMRSVQAVCDGYFACHC